MIYTVTTTYNDASIINRCLQSLMDFDRVYVIDGKFPNVKGSNLSTDGTRDICTSYNNVILLDAPSMNIAEKKQLSHEQATSPKDVAIFIDPDCYVAGDVGAFKKACKPKRKLIYGTGEVALHVKHWHRKPEYTGKVLWRAWVVWPWNLHTPANDHGRYL